MNTITDMLNRATTKLNGELAKSGQPSEQAIQRVEDFLGFSSDYAQRREACRKRVIQMLDGDR
jgi:hypothetical protein